MSQTLLAVLALALLSLLVLASLEDRNGTISTHAQDIVREEARGLSTGLLERVAGLPFQSGPARTAPADFGPPPGTAWAGQLIDSVLADAADIDDLHGADSLRAEVLLEHPVSGLSNPLVFEAGLAVEYVAPGPGGWASTADTVAQKRVTLRVRHVQTGQDVTLKRMYSDLGSL